ncbi:MAG: hypothetical protein HY879_17865 [Deltaproteobacteria bacterium]|nr:hypothetical protein [Deltaproteobacteria bacterium]
MNCAPEPFTSSTQDKSPGFRKTANGAAALLGLKRSTLYTRMKRLGLSG